MHENVTILQHPLVDEALSRLRDANTSMDEFRRHSRLVAHLLAIELLADIPTRAVEIQTPLQTAKGRQIDCNIVFVPVLRSGLALLDAMSDLVPGSRVGFVGMERDETTAIARSYYSKLPQSLEGAMVIILDPMLATGGSAAATIALLRQSHAATIRLACVVASPEGVEFLKEDSPDVSIFTAALDTGLNERKYILPGLGDFGDRYYGTI